MLITFAMRFTTILCLSLGLIACPGVAFASGGHVPDMPLWSLLPFLLMLGAIAALPLTAEHWWESNKNKLLVSAVLGVPVGGYFLYAAPAELYSVGFEYLSFMVLLGSLFVVSGGIVLRGDLRATPLTNTIFLAVGTALASFMGTTGAAMVLIRPVIKTNLQRKHKVHTIIFFIFLVANIGGSLTPLGDPPLFMGYLRGVPFMWTFGLWRPWLFLSAIVLVVYYIWDTVMWRKESAEAHHFDATNVTPLHMAGYINFPLLIGVVLLVALADKLPVFIGPGSGVAEHLHASFGMREVGMVLIGVISMVVTSKALREENSFNFHPINEVAALFFGIFLTMIPALIYLRLHGAEMGVTEPWQYFWATGTLSSFLDNTPTYVVFFDMARASFETGAPEALGPSVAGVPESILVAISIGAVFMGAMTYIGNGPNFMVKAIADANGIKMPSFFGYFIYALVVLVPALVLVSLLFL